MSQAHPFSQADKALISTIAHRVRMDQEKEILARSIRLEEARLEARRVSESLASLEGVRRVIHFGSSATGRGFRLDSDIDLAISGGDLLEAMGVAENSAFHVDVIDIDRVPSPLRESILEEGVVVHEVA
ncbi:MAG: nucleotidyltransferase domain-containing protein [Spirochaetota bacterium]